MNLIIIINCLSLTFGLTYCYRQLFKNHKYMLIYFIITSILYVSSFHVSHMLFRLYLMLIAFFTMFYVSFKQKDMRIDSLEIIVDVLVYYRIFITVLGSISFIFFENIKPDTNMFYNIIISLLIIFMAFLYKNFEYISKNRYVQWTNIIYKFFLFIIAEFLLPALLYLQISKKSYGIISIMFMIFIIFSELYRKRLLRMQVLLANIKKEKQLLRCRMGEVEKKYDDVISIKHYFHKIYKSLSYYIQTKDMARVRSFFEEHITPLHEQYIIDKKLEENIDMIEIELIRVLLLDTLLQLSDLELNNYDLHIQSNLSDVSILDIDLFRILTIYFDNALEDLSQQEKGYFLLSIQENIAAYDFLIINSLENNESKKKEHNNHKGLEIAKELVSRYKNIHLLTKKRNNEFIQVIKIEKSDVY